MDFRPLSAAAVRPPLDTELATFVRGGVTVSIATRDTGLVPHLTRGIGCHLDAQRVVVFVPRGQARSVLADIAANRQVAVVFSQPSTHRTVQLKGSDATTVPLDADGLACVQAYRRALCAELGSIGYPDDFTEALLEGADDDPIGIAFTPDAAFTGTPGPQAGAPLEAAR